MAGLISGRRPRAEPAPDAPWALSEPVTAETDAETDDQAVAEVVTPFFREGQGTPVVLLHGITMSWRVWRPVLPYLVARHDVFAPTLAGHRGGPGLRPGAKPGVTAIVDVLCDQMDEAGIDTAHLVGNSLGGWVALELARRGRARSVLGISPAGTWRARRDLQRLLWMFRAGHTMLGSPRLSWMGRYPTTRRLALSQMVARTDRIPDADVAGLFDDFTDCPLFAALVDGTAQLHRLVELDVALCPVTIAWGQKDRLIPYHRYGRPMREVVRGAEFITLPDVGHVPMYDDPRLVARTILEMIAPVDAAHRPADRPAGFFRRRGSRPA
jgi:pimeloyl-ACP methyl ester carboxylesterase